MTKVKICGITNLEDALIAAKFGADALGFNFYERSPRSVSSEKAQEISVKLPKEVMKVGVFVNDSFENIISTTEAAMLDAVQLHGDENVEFVRELKRRTDAKVIKAFRVSRRFASNQAADFEVEAVLLDAYSPDQYGGTGDSFDWRAAEAVKQFTSELYLAGGLTPDNVAEAIRTVRPYAVDVASGVESEPRKKDFKKLEAFIKNAKGGMKDYEPNEHGYWGEYGGRFVPETLVAPLDDLTEAYFASRDDAAFRGEFDQLLKDYVGRPTPLYFAERLTEKLGGARIYLKREDLNHTGAHKINNCIGQILLARRMGKSRIIAETGAGQHGVATATVCARFALECVIYMGTEDMRRQELNVFRMRLLGAEVRGVDSGSQTLKDAINEALRDWVTNVETTYYLLGSALGPHPYPVMVRDFQSVIGRETREQILEKEVRLPDLLIACVGGGSNSIGLFHEFLTDKNVRMIGVEAGGSGSKLGSHAARFMNDGAVGVLQGTKSYLLQDENGQIALTHSISAGLDYASIGPEHAFLHDAGRVEYVSASDDEALAAFQILSETEGIIPALESAHAIAYLIKAAPEMPVDSVIVVNLSGRGDKDVNTVAEIRAVGRVP